jgi:hypothetical protein
MDQVLLAYTPRCTYFREQTNENCVMLHVKVLKSGDYPCWGDTNGILMAVAGTSRR